MKDLLANKAKALKFIIGTYLTLAILLVGYSFWHGTYHVVEEDESIYYNTARCFAETGSVRAPDCNSEGVSRIAQCNWYGPAYNIFYGSIAKLVGVHSYNFLITNLLCLGLIIVLILRAQFTKEVKLMILASLLALYSVIGYVFTFFPETLELLFAVILTLQLKSLFTDEDNSSKKTRIYILLCMFFAVFRVTTVFWVFAILALSKSGTDFVKKLAISIACFLLIYIYIYYFNAPFYGGSMSYVMTHKLGPDAIMYLLQKGINNLYAFFTRNAFYDLLQIPVLFIAVYTWVISKNRLILAACIVATIYYSVLFVLYEPYSYFFNKQVACIYPLVLIALYTTNAGKLKHLVVFLLILFSPLTYIKAARAIMAHKAAAVEFSNNIDNQKQFSVIGSKVAMGKAVTILTVYRDFDPVMPFPIFATSVPVSTTDKQPILYSSCFPLDAQKDSTIKNERNFQLYHRLHIDYILSRQAIALDSTTLTYSCNLFYLYRNNRQAK